MAIATYRPQSGDPVQVAGLFDHPTSLEEGLSEAAVIRALAQFTCRSIDLPVGAAEDDQLEVEGFFYTVTALLPDGTGMTTLRLREQ